MDSTEGPLMITSIGLGPSTEWHRSPGHERLNLSLRSLLSNIFSGTSCESFEEGYSQLTDSGKYHKITVHQKAVKIRPPFRATSVLVEKILHFLLSNHRNPNLINYMQIYDRFELVQCGAAKDLCK